MIFESSPPSAETREKQDIPLLFWIVMGLGPQPCQNVYIVGGSEVEGKYHSYLHSTSTILSNKRNNIYTYIFISMPMYKYQPLLCTGPLKGL